MKGDGWVIAASDGVAGADEGDAGGRAEGDDGPTLYLVSLAAFGNNDSQCCT